MTEAPDTKTYAMRQRHVDLLYYTAYNNEHVSVHVRLQARDALRQIKENTYEWPPYLSE